MGIATLTLLSPESQILPHANCGTTVIFTIQIHTAAMLALLVIRNQEVQKW
jgi:hypothetical protein